LPATVQFAGLAAPGLFQFNVYIPANAATGDNAITATYNGARYAPSKARMHTARKREGISEAVLRFSIAGQPLVRIVAPA
jgi:hypothetical protein